MTVTPSDLPCRVIVSADGEAITVSDPGQTVTVDLGEGFVGPPGMIWLDAYAAGTTYAQYDAVEDGGSSYISLANANTGHTPASSPTWWKLLAAAGVSVLFGDGPPTEDGEVSAQVYVDVQVGSGHGSIYHWSPIVGGGSWIRMGDLIPRTIESGGTAPGDGVGQDGDFYVDTTGYWWGPKVGGTWVGTGPLSLVGPQGPAGKDGAQGPPGTTDHGALTGLTDADHPAGAINMTAADRIVGSTTSAGAATEIPCYAAGRALLDDANAAAQLVTLGALPAAGGSLTGELNLSTGGWRLNSGTLEISDDVVANLFDLTATGTNRGVTLIILLHVDVNVTNTDQQTYGAILGAVCNYYGSTTGTQNPALIGTAKSKTSSGTLTVTARMSSPGAGIFRVNVTADTSLTPTRMTARWVVIHTNSTYSEASAGS